MVAAITIRFADKPEELEALRELFESTRSQHRLNWNQWLRAILRAGASSVVEG